ncbi:N-acetylglucosamine/diacetylchitobiose ABC transporter substrate-binding protein [Streptosporangium carneum]|uniref:N-acetylglucosamine/diacetylchitobiose ABC transporter substrate-binding protein n=1 Tax=Streptosporangium carneum TaxID=47481 RepID=UPI0022F2E884|nr:N-acetylglucosamine/diacetylchitobiose ABC transporter substrate-binding protein [Streptosporangium carneum]
MGAAGLSRRELLRGAVLAGLCPPALSACAGPWGRGGAPAAPVRGATSAANPLGLVEDGPLEVWIFDGGLGDGYARTIHEPLVAGRFPRLRIRHNATKEIAKALQPRFAGGDPPELVNNSGANAMEFGALVQDGRLTDLTPLYDAPSWDDPSVTVRETVDAAAIELGSYDGRPYVMNYATTVWGIWYSRALFEARGWRPPRTWAQFLALCETVGKSGTAPFTYAGTHPQYICEAILTLAAKIGGREVLRRIDNLEEGAWLAEPVRQAAEAFAEIGAKHLLQGTAGLDHVQTQTAQNRGRVAMLPCGSWLENEQRGAAPAGFDYAMFPLPDFGPSDAMPYGTLHAQPGEEYIVPAGSANPRAGLEYMRAMLSRRAAGRFTEAVSTLTVVKGASEGHVRGPGLRSASTALAEAGEHVVSFLFRKWYAELHDEVAAVSGRLMNGGLTVGQWAERAQRRADAIRNDSSVRKFTR